MKEQTVIDLTTVIGVYPICNTGAVLVHQIDYGEDKVLASVNGADPEWCSLEEEYMEATEELELGFRLGEWFIPFCEVMRFYGGS